VTGLLVEVGCCFAAVQTGSGGGGVKDSVSIIPMMLSSLLSVPVPLAGASYQCWQRSLGSCCAAGALFPAGHGRARHVFGGRHELLRQLELSAGARGAGTGSLGRHAAAQ